jgi:glycosyltransferase involved in cell wall biosynthesis
MNNTVEVSIVMACRNSDKKSIFATIESVLNQTFSDFEFIIIDDGSEIPIKDMIQDFNDPRIKLHRISPSGLGAALNYGVSVSNGKYISRIDDDDLMLVNRLERQRNYMIYNPNIACVGTHIFLKYENRFLKYRKFPINHSDILKDLTCLRFSLAHTSVMYTRKAFDRIGGYRIKGGGQDLDLFFQLATQGEISNIDEYLTIYNLSNTGLSVSNPIKKYEAYLFALKELKYTDLPKTYNNFIKKSIERLEKKLTKKKTINIGRNLLILYVKLIGKKLI